MLLPLLILLLAINDNDSYKILYMRRGRYSNMRALRLRQRPSHFFNPISPPVNRPTFDRCAAHRCIHNHDCPYNHICCANRYCGFRVCKKCPHYPVPDVTTDFYTTKEFPTTNDVITDGFTTDGFTTDGFTTDGFTTDAFSSSTTSTAAPTTDIITDAPTTVTTTTTETPSTTEVTTGSTVGLASTEPTTLSTTAGTSETPTDSTTTTTAESSTFPIIEETTTVTTPEPTEVTSTTVTTSTTITTTAETTEYGSGSGDDEDDSTTGAPSTTTSATSTISTVRTTPSVYTTTAEFDGSGSGSGSEIITDDDEDNYRRDINNPDITDDFSFIDIERTSTKNSVSTTEEVDLEFGDINSDNKRRVTSVTPFTTVSIADVDSGTASTVHFDDNRSTTVSDVTATPTTLGTRKTYEPVSVTDSGDGAVADDDDDDTEEFGSGELITKNDDSDKVGDEDNGGEDYSTKIQKEYGEESTEPSGTIASWPKEVEVNLDVNNKEHYVGPSEEKDKNNATSQILLLNQIQEKDNDDNNIDGIIPPEVLDSDLNVNEDYYFIIDDDYYDIIPAKRQLSSGNKNLKVKKRVKRV